MRVQRYTRFVGPLVLAASAFAQTTTFTDQTASAGLSSTYQSTANFQHYSELGGGAAADFDRDGWQDLFVTSGAASGQPDKLYINNGDGTFTNEAASWGLVRVHDGKGVAVGDINNDGFPDIYMTSAGDGSLTGGSTGEHVLYRNNGNRTFTDIALSAGVNLTGSDREDACNTAMGDYDLDGYLDIFVGAFRSQDGQTIGNNTLFRNNGNETFTNVTGPAGVFDNSPVLFSTWAVRFADMDGDRYPELLLVGDFSTSRYYRNNQDGTFTDITDSTGTNNGTDEMGAALIDFDGDGLLDWFVTDIYWPGQNKPGNHLYRNKGNHLFQDVAVGAGVEDGQWGWAAVAIDANLDGLPDLIHTNGHFTDARFLDDPTRVFLNQDGASFQEVAQSTGLNHSAQGRGMLNFDYDNDGDQDLVIFAWEAPMVLFRNDLSGPNTNWLRVFMNTSANANIAPDGWGSRVTVVAGGRTQTQYICPGDNHVSQSEISAAFGLSGSTIVDSVTVDWPDGSFKTLTNVAVNQTMTIAADPPIPPGDDLATAVRINDTGETNPDVLVNQTLPVLGNSWVTDLDASVRPETTVTYLIGNQSRVEQDSNFGVLLVDFALPFIIFQSTTPNPSGLARFAVGVPINPAFIGVELYVQGAMVGGVDPAVVTNGYHITLGL